MCNVLIQFSLTMVLSIGVQYVLKVHSDFPNTQYICGIFNTIHSNAFVISSEQTYVNDTRFRYPETYIHIYVKPLLRDLIK
jgi:hypothetical protein